MDSNDQPDQSANQLQSLNDLIINNPDMERLESLLAQFNIFEALGAVRVELRHSDFLAYLLDPLGNHGFGDAFVKRLLQTLLQGLPPSSLPVKPIELDL